MLFSLFSPVTLFTDLFVGVWKSFTFTSVLAELKSPMSASQRRGRCPRMGTQKKLRKKWDRLKASSVRTGLHSAGHLWSRHSLAQHRSSRSSFTSVSCSRRSRLPEVGGPVTITSVFWWEGEEKGQQTGVTALDQKQSSWVSSPWQLLMSQLSNLSLYHHGLDYGTCCSVLGLL